MEILLSTGSLTPRTLRDSAGIARRAGADGLELLLNGRLLAAGPERAAAVAAEEQVPIRSVHPPIRFWKQRGHTHDDLIAAAEYARAIPSCDVLVMHAVAGPGLHTEIGRQFFRTVEEVKSLLRGSNTRLAIENRGTMQPQPRMGFLDKLQNLYRVCEEWDLDITLDTSHAASFGVDIVAALDIVFPRLANIHLSDRREEPPAITSGVMNSLTREHQLPRAGALPLGTFVRRLHARAYRGMTTLELSPAALASWSGRRALQRTTQSVAFVREHASSPAARRADAPGHSRRAPAPAENDF